MKNSLSLFDLYFILTPYSTSNISQTDGKMVRRSNFKKLCGKIHLLYSLLVIASSGAIISCLTEVEPVTASITAAMF
jgi:hypothetical protein